MTNWKKVGYRSIQHLGSPKLVVRFGRNGGRAKLLEDEAAWIKRVQFSGREPAAVLAGLMREAGEFWKIVRK